MNFKITEQSRKDWWHVFAGIIIGGIPSFIIGYEIAKSIFEK